MLVVVKHRQRPSPAAPSRGAQQAAATTKGQTFLSAAHPQSRVCAARRVRALARSSSMVPPSRRARRHPAGHCLAAALAVVWAAVCAPGGAHELAPPATAVPSASVVMVTTADGDEGAAMVHALLHHNGGGAPATLTVVAGVANASAPAARALAAAGAQVREVALPAAAPESFAGVDWAFIVAPLTADRLEVARGLMDAARAAGVPRAALLSVAMGNRTAATLPGSMEGYQAQEEHLARTFPEADRRVVLRTFFYQQNLLLWAADARTHNGTLRLPLRPTASGPAADGSDDGDANENGATPTRDSDAACFAPLFSTDVAEVVAALVLQQARTPAGAACHTAADGMCGWGGAVLNLTGPTSFNAATLSAAASAGAGFPLRAVVADRATAAGVLEQSGELDPSEAALLLDLLEVQQTPPPSPAPLASGVDCPTTTVEAVTGQPAAALERFFAQHGSAFRPAAAAVGGGGAAGSTASTPPPLPRAGARYNLTNATLLALLQAEGLDVLARNNSIGMWVGLRTATASLSVALGYSAAPQFVAPNSTLPPTLATPEDVVPAGSLTKSFTAAAVMRFVEAGELGINDTAAPLADRALAAWGINQTLADLYPPPLANATLADLLSMSSGISEYSDTAVRAATDDDLLHDITPEEYLLNLTLNPSREKWRCGNATTCDPPTYCSMGFLVLALALAGHTGAASWAALDFKALALPAALLADPARPSYAGGLRFFTTGPCSAYPGVAHYYDLRGGAGATAVWEDLHAASCLNGWGFGNVGATATAAADFFFDLVGRDARVVGRLTALQMQQWGPVLAWHHTERYGLGLMYLPLARYGYLNASAPGAEPYSFGVGHNGCDYGTYTHNLYHPQLDAGISFMINRDQQLTANGSAVPGSGEGLFFCRAYRAVFRLLLGDGPTTTGFDFDTAFPCMQH